MNQPTTTTNRSALGILLDATELMVARDVNQGRTLEQTRAMFEAANAALAHVAQTLKLSPPTDLEKLKAALDVLVAKAAMPGTTGYRLAEIARTWFEEHPYDTDELTDEALSYFESFRDARATSAAAGPDAKQRLLATMMEALLIDQGMQPHEFDEAKARVILSNLRNAAARQAAVVHLDTKLEPNADAAIAAFRERLAGAGKKGKAKR